MLLLALERSDLCQIILQYRRQIYRSHNAVTLGIHTHVVDTIDIEDGDVEGVIQLARTLLHVENTTAYGVVLILQRAIHTSVGSVIVQIAQVPQQSRYGAYYVTLAIRLDEHRGV